MEYLVISICLISFLIILKFVFGYSKKQIKAIGENEELDKIALKYPENIEIFESVLDNKFGEYINGVDKRALVKILNGSRSPSRSNG